MKAEVEIAIEAGTEVEAVAVPDAEVDAEAAGEIEAEAEVKASHSHPHKLLSPRGWPYWYLESLRNALNNFRTFAYHMKPIRKQSPETKNKM